MKKWTKLTLPSLFRRSIVKIDITIWGEVPRQLLQNFSLDNFGANSGDLDRSLYNPSMITRLLQAVTHFADDGSRAFHETRPSFNYISYTYPRDPGRGHLSVEDAASVVDERFPRETRL